ncbi:MAG: class I SAM-dependent methyltransferase [Candidatus Hydrogenedentes bacterium]|nr:class I SAM-dependent methyltransferase [Candidatus Hydrogenedentota bacterium]
MSKGWFSTPGRGGDRTLEQQMVGLESAVVAAKGGVVLDVGCAEGLIAMEFLRAGAREAVGVERVAAHLDVARTLRDQERLPLALFHADANVWDPTDCTPYGGFDVVLLLAILHKLKDPSAAAHRFGAVTKSLCVVRLPASGEVIRDERSGYVPHDIGVAMRDAGLSLVDVVHGTYDEWIGYYARG